MARLEIFRNQMMNEESVPDNVSIEVNYNMHELEEERFPRQRRILIPLHRETGEIAV